MAYVRKKNTGSFPKGVSGNLNGKPRNHLSMGDKLKKELRKTVEIEMADGSILKTRKHDVVAMRLVEKAMSGDMTAIRTVLERIDGAPTQAVEITGDIAQRITRIPEYMTGEQRLAEFNRIMAEAASASAPTPKPINDKLSADNS